MGGTRHSISQVEAAMEIEGMMSRQFDSRLDADKYIGLRREMELDGKSETKWLTARLTQCGELFVSLAIFANAAAMGLSIQYKREPEYVWFVLNHIFTAIFAAEMLIKLYASRFKYFKKAWNLLDFFITNLSIFSYWIIPLFAIKFDLGFLTVLRLLRLLRVVRLLRINRALESLVEGLLVSLQSLVWSLLLLLIITYIFALVASQLIDPAAYFEDIGDEIVDHFSAEYFFGDVAESMLTLFNVCILAEWVEIIRPIWYHQFHLVLLVFLPYLMLCTFGVLNLIIGVIAEQTLVKMESEKEERESLGLRDKMKLILLMTDEMYEGDGDGLLTKKEFLRTSHTHPGFMELMRQCDFPRGFDVSMLHTIFDESSDGHVGKAEFISGMFRLVFNSLPQHAVTLLLSVSQLKHELCNSTNRRLDDLTGSLDRRLERLSSEIHSALPCMPSTPRDVPPKAYQTEDVRGSDKSRERVKTDLPAADQIEDICISEKHVCDQEKGEMNLMHLVKSTPDALHHELKQLDAKMRQSREQLKRVLESVLHSSHGMLTGQFKDALAHELQQLSANLPQPPRVLDHSGSVEHPGAQCEDISPLLTWISQQQVGMDFAGVDCSAGSLPQQPEPQVESAGASVNDTVF